MKKGDYIDLCFVAHDVAQIKRSMFIAPPWTVHEGDKVELPDNTTGDVILAKTIPYESEEYFDLLTIAGTKSPGRLSGVIKFTEFKYGDEAPEEQEEQPA